jgi:hypothetical protein
VQAEGFVASHLFSQAPGFDCRTIRNPRVRVIEVSSTKAGKKPKGRGIATGFGYVRQ